MHLNQLCVCVRECVCVWSIHFRPCLWNWLSWTAVADTKINIKEKQVFLLFPSEVFLSIRFALLAFLSCFLSPDVLPESTLALNSVWHIASVFLRLHHGASRPGVRPSLKDESLTWKCFLGQDCNRWSLCVTATKHTISASKRFLTDGQ